MTSAYRLHKITSLDDAWLLPWLELYETAFPARERVLVAGLLMQIQEQSQESEGGAFFFAWIGADEEFKGMALYEVEGETGLLWYLAIDPRWRGLGLGSYFYQALLQDMQNRDCRALLFEVEKPEEAEDPEQRLLAERRIRFYQRLGAHLLTGITYLQFVGSHVPATPMHLMVHPFEPLKAQQAFNLAKACFGENLNQVGLLKLE